MCVSAPAQSLSGDSGSSVDGGRPPTTRVDLFGVLDSATDVLIEQFEPAASEPAVDQPRWNQYDSPRGTVMTFIEAMNHVASGRDEAWPRAEASLGDIDATDRRRIAMNLLSVFDRLPKISPGSIPGPDTVRSRDLRRWELFPRGIDSRWAYKAIDGGPDGSITLVDDGSGRWRFDESTVRHTGDLLESVRSIPPRPRLSRKGDLVKSVAESTITQTSAADWGFFLAVTAAGVAVAWVVVSVLRRWRRQIRDRGDGFLLPLVSGSIVPAGMLIVTLATAIGTSRLHFHPTLADFRTGLVEAALLLSSVFLGVAILEMIILGTRRALGGGDDPYAQMVSTMIRRVLRLAAGVVLVLFLLQNVFRWDVTALLGGFAIIALALSLAAQDAVKNLFGAFTIFATRPFLTGDWIRFDERLGTVEDVSLQATQIRLLSGELYSVPNMKFIDNAVENLARRRYIRRVLNVAVTYDTPPEKIDTAIDILRDILTDPAIVGGGRGDTDEHPPHIAFDRFAADYLNLRVDYWYLMSADGDGGDVQRDTDRGYLTYLDHATEVNRRILHRFNESGIDFAFPTQTLHLSTEDDRPLPVAPADAA